MIVTNKEFLDTNYCFLLNLSNLNLKNNFHKKPHSWMFILIVYLNGSPGKIIKIQSAAWDIWVFRKTGLQMQNPITPFIKKKIRTLLESWSSLTHI